MPPTGVSAHDSKRSSLSVSSTLSSFSFNEAAGSRRRAENANVSLTVSPSKTRSSCSTNATCRFKAEDQVRSSPPDLAAADRAPPS